MKTFRIPTLSLSFVCALGSYSASAEVTNAEDKLKHSAPVTVVTATRVAKTANELVSSVRVIDSEEIERTQAQSVNDVLRNIAGLSVAQNGGAGQNTSVFLRGTNSNHVIVLVDGIKVGSATSGSTAFQDLPIDLIDRIEVVRGPRASLYGSEALGGVIQIFTKKGGAKTSTAKYTVGSHDTYKASLSSSGSEGGFKYGLGFSTEQTQGFDACKKEAATEFGGCFADQSDSDGSENFSINSRLAYEFNNGAEVALQFMKTDAEAEFDGNFQDSSESLERSAGIKVTMPIGHSVVTSLNISRSQDSSDSFLNDDFSSTFETERDLVGLQFDMSFTDYLTAVVGFDYQNDQVNTVGDNNFDGFMDENDQYERTYRENWGRFGQLLLEVDKHAFEASLRFDDNQQFGSKYTGSFGYNISLSDSLRFVASFGTAFAAPTFNQLYYPGFSAPDLEPETSRSGEVGIRATSETGRFSITMFKTKVDDLIAYDAAIFSSNNIDKAMIQGVEIELSQRLNAEWSLNADFAVIQATNKSKDANNGNELARRPSRSGTIQFDYNKDDYQLGLDLKYAGAHFDDKRNTRKLDAYKIVNLRGKYDVSEQFYVQSKVENLFDSDYETAKYYRQPDRTYYVSATYTF